MDHDVVDGEEPDRVHVAGVRLAVQRVEDRPGEHGDQGAVGPDERGGRQVRETKPDADRLVPLPGGREPDRQDRDDEEQERVQRAEHGLGRLEPRGRAGVHDDRREIEEEVAREPGGRDRRAEPLAERPVLREVRPLDPAAQAGPDGPAAHERAGARRDRDGVERVGAGGAVGRDQREDQRDLAAVAEDVDRERGPQPVLRVEDVPGELLELPGDERRHGREEDVGRREPRRVRAERDRERHERPRPARRAPGRPPTTACTAGSRRPFVPGRARCAAA